MPHHPFENIPYLLPKNIIRDFEKYEQTTHGKSYRPRPRCSGWITSTLKDVTVTYTYDVMLRLKPERNPRERYCNHRPAGLVVKVHDADYEPPIQNLGWRTLTVPSYIVTYCWDYLPCKWKDRRDAYRKSIGVTDSTTKTSEDAGNDRHSEQNDSRVAQWAMDLRVFNEKGKVMSENYHSVRNKDNAIQDGGSVYSGAAPDPEIQDHRSDRNSFQTDDTDWDRELRGVNNTGMRTVVDTYGATEISEQQFHPPTTFVRYMVQSLSHPGFLDPASRRRALCYFQKEQPSFTFSDEWTVERIRSTFSLRTLREVCRMILNRSWGMSISERDTRYFGTRNDNVQWRVGIVDVLFRETRH